MICVCIWPISAARVYCHVYTQLGKQNVLVYVELINAVAYMY